MRIITVFGMLFSLMPFFSLYNGFVITNNNNLRNSVSTFIRNQPANNNINTNNININTNNINININKYLKSINSIYNKPDLRQEINKLYLEYERLEEELENNFSCEFLDESEFQNIEQDLDAIIEQMKKYSKEDLKEFNLFFYNKLKHKFL
jgi:hypothetical protein